MGSWFNNFHIKKGETATEAAVVSYITNMLTSQNYVPAASPEEADGAVAILSGENSPWISVYSDLLPGEDPKAFHAMAMPLSKTLGTDVLGIFCFDSDYLGLNLVNAAEKADAWLGIGSARGLGLRRRTTLAGWKNKVLDFSAFSAAAKQQYDCAEEFLECAEAALGLDFFRACAGYEHLRDLELDSQARYFYYKLPDDGKPRALPRLEMDMISMTPCFIGEPTGVSVVNKGGASKGLSVFFLGPYVEQEDITFSKVHLFCHTKSDLQHTPIQLAKVQLKNGQWAYYYHDPAFPIPEKVNAKLPFQKRFREESKRTFGVSFTPVGNSRKILEITVVLVPDKNPQGGTVWNILQYYSSKEELIQEYNSIPWPEKKLRAEDFD